MTAEEPTAIDPEATPTVLVVDDDTLDRERYRRALCDDHRLVEATSVDSARDLLVKTRIDVALVDYRLSDGHGLELAQELAKLDIPMILVTGVGTEHVAADAFKQGCLEYLSKDGLNTAAIRLAVTHVMEKALFNRVIDEKRQKLKQYAQELERVNEELSVFASFVAHDLLEPLRSIEDSATRLGQLLALEDEDEVAQMLAFHHSESKRAAQLIQRLLEYARVDHARVHFQTVSLSEVVSKVADSLQAVIESSGAKIRSESLPNIVGDPLQLHQLFQNVIGNSIKHADGRAIEISISAQSRADHAWEITVRDDGQGMNSEELQSLLAGHMKRGIGLEICKKVVLRHQGTLHMDSSPGQGMTVSITLPDNLQIS